MPRPFRSQSGPQHKRDGWAIAGSEDLAETKPLPPRVKSPATGYILAGAGAILFSMKGILAKLAYGDAAQPDVDAMRNLERVKGIEPSYSAWKAAALPLSYTRGGLTLSALEEGSTEKSRNVGLHSFSFGP